MCSSPTTYSMTYFYPRPPRGGRPLGVLVDDRVQHISIHALREEGDSSPLRSGPRGSYFYPRPPRGGRRRSCSRSPGTRRISIHALREEGDGELHDVLERAREFLSTPSARRAT